MLETIFLEKPEKVTNYVHVTVFFFGFFGELLDMLGSF